MNDEFFNHSAAAWAREVVMKLDDDAAEAFVEHVTYNVLLDDMAANERTLSRHTATIQKSLEAAVSRGVSKHAGSSVHEVVELVSKAFGDDKYTRGANGRFAAVETRVRTGSKAKPLSARQASRVSVPKATDAEGRRNVRLSPQDNARYQQQYFQLAQALNSYSEQGIGSPTMLLEDKKTGNRRTVPINGSKPDLGWNPGSDDLIAVRGMVDNSERAAAGTFNLVGALAGPAAAGTAAGAVAGVSADGQQFANQWTASEGLDTSTNARTYRRVAAGSRLLGSVAVGNDATSGTIRAAAKLGEFVGEYGPEAEKVVGPAMRQTAYRYRGTERTPDDSLIASANSIVTRAVSEEMGSRLPRADVKNPNSYVERNNAIKAGVTPSIRTTASTMAATNYLRERVPNTRLAELQRKSGKIPPSEGVVIDASGKIVTQAVGVTDDHYLPFNLKNLKGLKGGSYVRSRSQGGLTTEDIYTGLVSGARSVTVVSNSGVFTVNFEDDFRGSRRHSDKARGMVDRYAKTLDAVKGGQVTRDQEAMRQARFDIREEVESEMAGERMSDIQAEIDRRVQDYRGSTDLTRSEVGAIEDKAQRAGGGDERQYRRARADMLDQAIEAKAERFYRLDGEGYATAAQALKEQFPYYIKDVNFIHHRQSVQNGVASEANPESGRGFNLGTDRGYVKPRYNRPEGASEGYYDDSITGRGKVSADRTNFQNWPNNPENRRGGSAQATTPTDGAKPAGTLKPVRAADEVRQVRAEMAAEGSHKDAMKELVSHFSQVNLNGGFPTMQAARENLDAVYNDPNRRRELRAEAEGIRDNMMAGGGANADHAKRADALFAAERIESGRLGGQTFDRSKHLGSQSATPFSFAEPGYTAGSRPEETRSAMIRQASKLQSVLSTETGDFTDDKLAANAANAGAFSQVLAGEDNGIGLTKAVINLGSSLGKDDKWADTMLSRVRSMSPEQRSEASGRYADAAESLERVRRLKVMTTDAPTETATALPSTVSAGVKLDRSGVVLEIEGVMRGVASGRGNVDITNAMGALRRAVSTRESDAEVSARLRDVQDVAPEMARGLKTKMRDLYPDLD